MTTRCLCLSLSAHSTGVLSDVDLIVPMMGVSADSREDPASRRGFRRPGRGAGGWGPGIAHVALGRRVKARASSRAGRAVYFPGKDLSFRAQPGIRRGLERGGKGPRIRPTGHRGAQERGPVRGIPARSSSSTAWSLPSSPSSLLRTSWKPRPSQPTWQPWPGPDAALPLA